MSSPSQGAWECAHGVDAQDKVLVCGDCGEALTREDHRTLVDSLAKVYEASSTFEFDIVTCPACGSKNINDLRNDFDRAFEKKAFKQ